MKNNKILIYFLLINLISSNLYNSKFKSIRDLWEETMDIPSGRPENEKTSLNHCAKPNYKYFSYVLTGAPVLYERSGYDYGSVR